MIKSPDNVRTFYLRRSNLKFPIANFQIPNSNLQIPISKFQILVLLPRFYPSQSAFDGVGAGADEVVDVVARGFYILFRFVQ